jgi:hypothetical protein
VASMRQEILDGEQFLGPLVVRSTTAVPSPGGSSTGEDWRHSVREIFDSAQKAQIDVVRLLAGSGDAQNDPEALSRDFNESVDRAKGLSSLLLDHASGPFLTDSPVVEPPNKNEIDRAPREKP